MIPVRQTRHSAADGDCFEAALASLLEVELADVPRWDSAVEFAEYRPALDAWLEPRGLLVWPMSVLPEPEPLSRLDLPPQAIVLAGVRTPASHNHALIVRGGEILWDPYPEGNRETGLLGGNDPLVDWVFLLVPVDPARMAVA